MQASEVIKLIVGIGRPLVDRLLTYSLLDQETFTIALTKHPGPEAEGPSTRQAFAAYTYAQACSTAISELRATQVVEKLSSAVLIDVREIGEHPQFLAVAHEKMPFSTFEDQMTERVGQTVVFFCQSGVRSKKAAAKYRQMFPKSKEVYSVDDSVYALLKQFSNE